MPKMGAAVLSFLLDVLSGEHDRGLEDLCRSHSGPLGMIRWSELGGKVGQTWREISRQLGFHKQAVTITDSAPQTGN